MSALLTDEQIERAVQSATAGCCMNDQWRHRLCQFHEGYRDGLYRAQELIGEWPPEHDALADDNARLRREREAGEAVRAWVAALPRLEVQLNLDGTVEMVPVEQEHES